MMKPRKIGFSIVFAGILISVSAKQSFPQNSAPKFSLTISAPESVTLGSGFNIEIRLTNTSEESLILNTSYHGNFPDGYKYIVRGEKGDLISGSPCDQRITNGAVLQPPCRAPGSFRTGSLRPGETWTTMARLTDKYSFDRPGRYTIQISRQEAGMPIIFSNLIALAVVPKP